MEGDGALLTSDPFGPYVTAVVCTALPPSCEGGLGHWTLSDSQREWREGTDRNILCGSQAGTRIRGEKAGWAWRGEATGAGWLVRRHQPTTGCLHSLQLQTKGARTPVTSGPSLSISDVSLCSWLICMTSSPDT